VSGYLRLESLRRAFPGHVAVADLTLEVARGEILALLGPSGSGKTTTLRLLAGFEVPDAGRILVEGEDVTPLPPERRRFGMVFQNYALFPHLDVGENVGFGLRMDAAQKARRVAEALAMVDLAGFERRAVTALSGGQQQRVALARSLAPEPRVLLLDEPLSNLDPALRERTRRELREAIQRVGITTVFVTHEQEEAFDLGDRVAVLNRGRLEQVGTPDELYDRPATAFVAGFVGRANVLPGSLVGEPSGVRVLVRPEAMRLGDGPLAGEVTARRFAGGFAFFTVRHASGATFEVFAKHDAARVGDAVRASVARVLFREDAGGPA
jgi:ABC-type Fe3+/spermidine/putrescine transport system ATPase subunit